MVLYIGKCSDNHGTGGDMSFIHVKRMLGFVSDNIQSIHVSNNELNNWGKIRFGYGKTTKNQIDSILADGSCSIVVLGSSLYGWFANYLKRKYPDIPILVYFHNIEKSYSKELMRVNGISHFANFLTSSVAEYLTVKKCDWLWVLNERDSNLLLKLYNRKASLVLPFSIEDKAKEQHNSTSQEKCFLFVGSSFFANTEGVNWFVDQVLPRIEGKLIIVGSGMDTYYSSLNNERIEVHGFVEDLTPYYERAKFVIAPIFSGGGMKTKTAEALMYGKVVIGTEEAFEGFDSCESMIVCRNSFEFIKAINTQITKQSNFSEKSRQLYLNNYSVKAVAAKFTDWWNEYVIER